MIQELFAGSNLIAGERKISINSPSSSSSSLLLPPTTSSSTTTTTPANNSSSSDQNQNHNQNLRCPRCDSSNTKFCYYNNYNLTQPRHFCKTCRRYWTKGGALRNVPIGGGCRKNKTVGMSSASSAANKATTVTKMKAVVASELGRPGLVASGFDHDLQVQPSPILWGSPQNTHLLALLRATQNQNPNPNSNPGSMSVKEEGNLMGSNNHQSHMVAEPLIANGLMNIPRSTLGYDGGVGQVVPSLGLCTSSLWRNNNNTHHQDQNSGGFVLGENHQSSGIQELYHKIRANNSNYCNENSSSSSPIMFMGNMASSSSPSSSSLSTILESSSVVGGAELMGCWNPTLPWSDLPTTTTSGAYP